MDIHLFVFVTAMHTKYDGLTCELPNLKDNVRAFAVVQTNSFLNYCCNLLPNGMDSEMNIGCKLR